MNSVVWMNLVERFFRDLTEFISGNSAARQAHAAGQSESNAILETPHLGGRSACRGDRCRLHLAMLPVRLGPSEITPYFLARWPVSRLPHLENRRLGFEPLC